MRILQLLFTFAVTLIWPGIGLIYARAWSAGVTMIVLPLVFAAALAILTWEFLPTPVNVGIFLACLGIVILAVLALATYAALRVARGIRNRTASPPWYRSAWFASLISLALQVGAVSALKQGWRSFSIPSPSNLPSLHVGDFVICSIHRNYRPARGDMIVFTNNGNAWVKRVIALPGETIRISAGVVSINGLPAPRTDPRNFPVPQSGVQAIAYIEHLPGAAPHPTLAMSDSSDAENTRDVTVPANAYFVLGDNRDNSADSRFPSLGFVKQSAIIGRMLTIYWSHEKDRILTPVQ